MWAYDCSQLCHSDLCDGVSLFTLIDVLMCLLTRLQIYGVNSKYDSKKYHINK